MDQSLVTLAKIMIFYRLIEMQNNLEILFSPFCLDSLSRGDVNQLPSHA